MGRFSDAKPNSDNPTILQRALNYLIDLLDKGYEVSATVAGKKIVIKINTIVGIEITVDGVKSFGIDTNGYVFASRISTVDYSGVYGVVGYDPVSFISGLTLYNKYSGEPSNFKVGTTDDGFTIYCENTLITKYYHAATNTYSIYTTPKNSLNQLLARFQATDDYTYMGTLDPNVAGETNGFAVDIDGIYFDKHLTRYRIIDIPNDKMELFCPSNPTNRIGVDSTGAYKVTGGTKAYL